MIQETFPMTVGGDEVSNERTLLTKVKSGFIGYHFYIRKSGIVTQHRRLLEVGAHARGFNRCSIGICYEGGVDKQGNPADTRTPQQKTALLELLWKLHRLFPTALVTGHRDLPGVKKACPCFDASGEYNSLFH